MAQNSEDKDERKEEVGEGEVEEAEGRKQASVLCRQRLGGGGSTSKSLHLLDRGFQSCKTLMGKCREEERSGHRRASRHLPFRWRQQRAWRLVAGSPGLDTDSPTE